MGEITFILGGARSGKSSFAVKIAKDKKVKTAFIATCRVRDSEMEQRVRQHQKTRPSHWKTFEDIEDISVLLKNISSKFGLIIIDCLTLWVSEFIIRGFKQKTIENKIKEMLSILRKGEARAIIVSNEVGLGIVPVSELAREFRDVAGRINQLVARESDNVYFMVAGIGWKIKGGEK